MPNVPRYNDPKHQAWWESMIREELATLPSDIRFFSDLARRWIGDFEINGAANNILKDLTLRLDSLNRALERGDYR